MEPERNSQFPLDDSVPTNQPKPEAAQPLASSEPQPSPFSTEPEQPQQVTQPYVAQSAAVDTGYKKTLLNHVTFYGLELALAVYGLLSTSFALTYGVFMLCNYFKGIENTYVQQSIGEFSLWLVAMSMVSIVLAVLFYIRTKAAQVEYPANKDRVIHKLFVSIYAFVLIASISGLLLVSIYTLIRLLVGVEDDAIDALIRVIIPASIAIVINVGMLFAFREKISAKLFAVVFALVSLVLMGTLFAVSFMPIRNQALDNRATEDLKKIKSQIDEHVSTKNSLPNSLSQLETLDEKTKNRLGAYTYAKKSSGKYELCAVFRADTSKKDDLLFPASATSSKNSSQEYQSYVSFDKHPQGNHCFKIMTSSNYDYSGMFNQSLLEESLNGTTTPSQDATQPQLNN